MEFAFNDEQDLLRNTTRRFLQEHDSLGTLRSKLEEPEVFDQPAWQTAANLGWTAMLVPEQYGGGSVTDQPLVDLIVLGEELGRVLHPGPFVPTNVVADAIARWGSTAQKEDLLPPIVRGESIGAWCVSQDGSVTPDECGVNAVSHGESFELNGVARFVHGATVADVLLVRARRDDGYIHLLVSPASAGVQIRAQHSIDLTRRYGEVTFNHVVVDASHVLDGDAEALHARAISLATVLQSSEAVGAADVLFAETVTYLKDRMQFGRTIGSFQAIQHRVADMLLSLEGMRAATHFAALALGDGFDDSSAAVSTAGAFVPDALVGLCGESLQLFGGIGFTWDHDVHLFLRRAITAKELYGNPSWHREQLCALAEAI